MCKVLLQLNKNCRSLRHKITSILYIDGYTHEHTDRQTGQFLFIPENITFVELLKHDIMYNKCIMTINSLPGECACSLSEFLPFSIDLLAVLSSSLILDVYCHISV